VILDDKNEIVSFDSKLTSKQTMIRKNLSDSDLADDEVDDSSSDSSMDDTTTVNPWSNRLHHHHHSSNELAKKRDFIILDNLIASYKLPCILDLKMGTQLWFESDSEDKKRGHEEKSRRTTSASMGIRLQGLQLYSQSKNAWSYKDKYHGRDFDSQKLADTVKKFIREAPRNIRRNIAHVIRIKLIELRRIIEGLTGYRFYGTSLLVIYDSSAIEQLGSLMRCDVTDVLLFSRLVDIKMIDFAKSTSPGFMSDSQYWGPDAGYLLGLNSLIDIVDQSISSLEQQDTPVFTE